jgi:hypothetical protein
MPVSTAENHSECYSSWTVAEICERRLWKETEIGWKTKRWQMQKQSILRLLL